MKIKFKHYIKNLINLVIPLSFIKLIKKNLIKEKKKSVIRLYKNENISKRWYFKKWNKSIDRQ